MFTKFVFHKLREIKSFLKIVRGRLANDPEARMTGAKEAQNSAQDLRKVYQQEKQDALKDKQSSSNQDISAI